MAARRLPCIVRPHVALEPRTIVQRVGALPQFRGGAIIGLDGFMGAGKSRLAELLGHASGSCVVSTDRFVALRNGELSYPSRLAYGRLRLALCKALKSRRPVFLEGICLRAVARRLPAKPTAYIYVKLISSVGLWNDGLDVED